MSESSMSTYEELQPLSTGEVARVVEQYAHRRASGQGRRLQIVGGRTAASPGDLASDLMDEGVDILSTSSLSRVMDYPARDQTVTVEAGMRVNDLRDLLKTEQQRLPIDIPEGHRATLGGAIATNASGPGRFGHGTFRDYVIGIRGVDGQGRIFSAGGRVVKNVAGYDLCKLIVGSRGTLAVLTEVTLKLRPIPSGRSLVWMTFGDWKQVDRVLDRLLTSESRPVVVDVCDPLAARHILTEAKFTLDDQSPVLCLGFEGTEHEVSWQVDTVRREVEPFAPATFVRLSNDDTETLWSALTEYAAASDDPLSFSASLRPSRTIEFLSKAASLGVAVQAHAGNGIVVGHFPDSCSSPDAAARILSDLSELMTASEGHLQITKCDASWRTALRAVHSSNATSTVADRLRLAFDPHGVFATVAQMPLASA